MQFSILSIVLTVLTTSFLSLAAPATPATLAGLVPAIAPPAGVKLYNATAGYNATHGLPYEKKVHGPLTERDLQARQSYSGSATYFYPGLGACGGTNTAAEHIVALNVGQWDGGAHCWHHVVIQAYGKQVEAAIVDQASCPGCSWGDLDMAPGLFTEFTSLDVGRFGITWWYI
ncbi:unnamed protein product [Rhizoctonia solani]|uniref:RlpA-like protein double-psi beta-barrel domain-containing protein n=1 Tax=Rhizoctonia solani TaxID=456999 RepID=A0A8H3ALY9_9AGAM|nr:unnamed protein product [Rhizoctonia solani]